MSDEPDKEHTRDEEIIQRLVAAVGITSDQARELVLVLGREWSSLVREARLLIKAVRH